MAVQDIYNALDSALVGGAISLTSTTVADLGPTLLAYGIPAGSSLSLTGATLTINGNSVVLIGTGTYRSFSWTVTLTGASVSTGNQFTLTMLGQDAVTPWAFQTSFPTLPNSRVEAGNGSLPIAPSVLLPLVVQQPSFSVTTTPPSPASAVSLSFQGTLILTGSLFDRYIPYLNASSFTLSGTVNLAAPANPIIDLSAVASGADTNFPVIPAHEVGLKLRSDYPDDFALEGQSQIVSVVALYAKILIGSTTTDYVTLTAPLLQGDGIWPLTFEFSTPLTITKGVGVLLNFFGLPVTEGYLFTFPFADSVLNSFGLTSVEVGVQPPMNGKSLDIVYATLQFKATDTGLAWIPSVPFVKVTGLGTGWIYFWYPNANFVTGNIWGELTFFEDKANPSNSIVLVLNAIIPRYIFTATNKGDINVPLGSILQQYFGGSGGLQNNIVVKTVQVEGIPQEQYYYAYMLVEGIWSYTIGTVTFSLDRIEGNIFSNQSKVYGEISGHVSLQVPVSGNEVTKATFAVSAKYDPNGLWKFAGGLASGTLSLTDFAFGLFGQAPPFQLPTVNLADLWLTYETTKTGGNNPYSARGTLEALWNPSALGLTLSLTAKANFAYREAVSARDHALVRAVPHLANGNMIYEGSVSGQLKINSFAVTIGMSFVDTQQVYLFQVEYKGVYLRAVTRWVNDSQALPERNTIALADPQAAGQHEILVITLGGVTLGGVVEYLVNLANPNQNYHLDSPWSFLNDIDLSRFELQIDPSPLQTVTLLYNIDLTLPFIEVDSVGIRYDRSTGEGLVYFVVNGKFLGKSYEGPNALTWDAVNDPPPAVPGKGDQFIDLRYLGMGQHITLTGLVNYQSVADVLNALRDQMKPVDNSKTNPLSGSQLKFDASSQWMFGVDLTVLETVSAGIVLHDPDLYGLVISLAGPKSGSMAGFSFELLYKKVTDDIGVFRVRLQVPDAFRQIMLGPVSITLGIITVDVFTNGNFLVDLGFPHNRDFSASFGLQVGPFIGSGGVYFGVLNGATSQRVPVITNGVFNPVIELGLGLSAGVGRTFDKGPLKAGLYVQVLAIFEGVLAWFHPTDESASTEIYYWAQASAGIMGKLYGSVDFGIIKVSVSVEAKAIVTVTFAAYRHTDVELNVSVEVNAEIEILFITISFSFSLTIHASFTIGEDRVTPWILASGQSQMGSFLVRDNVSHVWRRRPNDVRKLTRALHFVEKSNLVGITARQVDVTSVYDLNWSTSVKVFPDQAIHNVTVKMLPVYGVNQPPVQWTTAPSTTTSDYLITFLLMADTTGVTGASTIAEARKQTVKLSSSALGSSNSSFNSITEGMLRWAISALGIDPVTGQIRPGDLEELAIQLDMPETTAALSYTTLSGFFTNNLMFQVSGIPSGSPASTTGAAFPIPPAFAWSSGAIPPPPDPYARDFSNYQMVDGTYEQEIQAYFEKINPQPNVNQSTPAPVSGTTESMATFIFRQYFLMVTKAAVQAALSLLASFPYKVLGTEKLTDICNYFPTITDQYTVHAGDTVDQVAQFYGYSSSEILALNSSLPTVLQASAAGTNISVVLGVTPESLAAGNPDWKIAALTGLQLGDIEYQVISTDTLSSIATRFGSNISTWLTSSDLLNKQMLLQPGAVLTIPSSSYVNSTSISLTLAAAWFYVRLRGMDHLGIVNTEDVPLVEWYAQAIAGLNTIGDGALPTTILVPSAFDVLSNPVTWTSLPGDTLSSVAATFAIMQNQASVADFGPWLTSVQGVNSGADPLPRINWPVTTSEIMPSDTLAKVAIRLPIEFPIPGQPNQFYSQSVSFAMLVENAQILTPLRPLTVPDCVVSSTTGQTLSSFAQLYDLSLEQVGNLLSGVSGLLLTSKDDQLMIPHPPCVPVGGVTATPADLVPAVLTYDGLTVSNQVSRFMMYGLRMPAPVLSGGKYHATGPMTGLYDLVGQQLDGPPPPTVAPTPPPVTELEITVQNTDSTNTPWIQFYDSLALSGEEEVTDDLHRLNPGLRHRSSLKGIVALKSPISEVVFRITNQDLFDNYPATMLVPAFITPPAALPLSQAVPVQHTLPQRVYWQTTEILNLPNPSNQPSPLAGMPTLWSFGGDLIQAALKYPTKTFELLTVDSQLGPSAQPTEPSQYVWASMVKIRVKPVAGRTNTYELFGADVAGRQELGDIWEYLKTNQSGDTGTIHLLYQQSVSAGLPNGLTSIPPDGTRTYVIKTNLSTETHSGVGKTEGVEAPSPTGDYYAPITDALNFLKLVWECSVVGGGGYWFEYTTPDGTGLPGSIFQSSGLEAASGAYLTLVITLSSQMNSTQPDRHLHSFNNVAIVGNTIPGSANVYVSVADLSETIPQATVEPGNIAFGMQLTRTPKNTTPINKQIALKQAYSLLGYVLQGSTSFAASNPALPIGPNVAKDGWGASQVTNENVWDLSQVIPISRFALTNYSPLVTGLPAPVNDPYAGISETGGVLGNATVSLTFRDVLGNSSDESGTALAGGPDLINIPVGYTDPIVGLSSWPSTTTSFAVGPPISGAGAALTTTISLQASSHLPGGSDRATSAVATAISTLPRFTQAYYQLSQPKVDVTLSTTLETASGVPVELMPTGSLWPFVAGTCAWLSSVAQLGDVGIGTSLTLTLGTISSNFGVGYDQLAAANADIPLSRIFASSAAVTIPQFVVYPAGATVKQICPSGTTPATVLGLPENIVLLLKPTGELVIPNRNYIVPTPIAPKLTDSLNTIAADNNLSLASLVLANSSTKSLLTTGFVFICEGVEVEIAAPHTDVSLEDVAATFQSLGVQFDALSVAAANADQEGMFVIGATLVIDAYIVKPGETLSDNKSGSSASVLAGINTEVIDLFPAGTTLYVGNTTMSGIFAEPLASAAKICGITPGQLLWQNRAITVAPYSSTLTNLAIPGQSAWNTQPANLRLPFTIPSNAVLNTVASLFLNADPTGVTSASLALAQANLNMPGVIAGGQTITVGAQHIPTLAGDSFASVIARSNPQVLLSDIVTAIEATSGYLAVGGLLLTPPGVLPTGTLVKPSDIATRYAIDSTRFAISNTSVTGLVASNVQLSMKDKDGNSVNITTGASDSLNSLVWRFAMVKIEASVTDIVNENADVAFINAGAKILLSPISTALTAAFGKVQGWRFQSSIFPLHVWVQIARQPDLVDTDFKGTATESDRSAIPPIPSTTFDHKDDGYLKLQQFASDLQDAIPSLKVATGKILSEERKVNPTDVWCVAFGQGYVESVAIKPGVAITKNKQQVYIPQYYALRPLANSLVSQKGIEIQPLQQDGTLGTAVPTDFQGIDMESWAIKLVIIYLIHGFEGTMYL